MQEQQTIFILIYAGFESDQIVGTFSSEELALKSKEEWVSIMASGPFCKNPETIAANFCIRTLALDVACEAWLKSRKEYEKWVQDLTNQSNK